VSVAVVTAVMVVGSPTASATVAPTARTTIDSITVPDPLDVGTAFPPSRDVAAVERRQSSARRAAPALVDDFATSSLQAVFDTGAPLPYQLTTPVTKARPEPSTPEGVPLRVLRGTAYNHPSNQAVWGIQQLESYRLVGDEFYLDRARAAAQHLIDTSLSSRGALWFPYPFDFAIGGDQSVLMPAPWYSAMAQGGVLSLFVRLWAVTGEPEWREAAEQTLTSLSLGPEAGLPWVSFVDASGHLWLEEYPRDPQERSERVLNGSIFAIYGLYDYLRLVPESTESSAARARALHLFDGGATTVRFYALSAFRAAGWISRYSLLRVIRNPHYHEVHTEQLLQMQYLTGVAWFAWAADILRSDYPTTSRPGSVGFAAGSHRAYLFNASGAVTASKTKVLPAASGAPNDLRARIRGQGIYFHITKGAFAGWWVRESWPATYQRSLLLRHDYFPTRRVTLPAGTWTAYKYSESATVVARKSGTYAAKTSAPASASAIIHGQLHLLISRGRYAGYWLPVTTGLMMEPVG
jgi:hypothetical protein